MPYKLGYSDYGAQGTSGGPDTGGGGIEDAPSGTGVTYGRRDGAWVGVLPIEGGQLLGPLSLSGDPVGPADATTRQWVEAALSDYLPITGGTASGLLLDADPAVPMGAATRQYVDAAVATAGGAFLPLSGGTLTGPLSIGTNAAERALSLNGPAGTPRSAQFQTAGLLRWIINANATAEGSGNVGSDLSFNRYADDGNYIDTAASFIRSTGVFQANRGLSLGSQIVTTTTDLSRHIALHASGGYGFSMSGGRMNLVLGAGGQFYFVASSGVDQGSFSSTTAIFSAYGGLVAGTNTATSASLQLNSAAGAARNVRMTTANSNRWALQTSAAVESGANAGSNFTISRYADDSTLIDSPIAITRSNGSITMSPGQLQVGNTGLAAQSFVSIRSQAGNERIIYFQSDALARWKVFANSSAESGSNAGSDFGIARYNDAGTLIDTPVTISRATGIVTMPNGLAVTGGTVTTGSNTSAFAVIINGPVGQGRNLRFQTAGQQRWALSANAAAESGGNAGSDLDILNYDDSGNQIGSPTPVLRIARATGQINTTGLLVSAGGLTAGGASVAATVSVSLSAVAGQERAIRWTSGSALRWKAYTSTTSEAGADAGSDWILHRYSDAGASLGPVITVTRSTGLITIANDMRHNGGISFFNTTPVAVKPAVSGSRGANAALASLLTTLASFGLITDSTTA